MKKIFKIVAVAAIVATVGVTSYNVQADELRVSSLAMDNVEALAWGEKDSKCPNGCLAEYGFCHCYEDYFLRDAK